jgi:predicted dehydrogenase
MKPLRVAVLGAGMIGRRHIETILSTPEAAELVGVADPVADRSKFELEAATWFTDAKDLLDRAKPEAVIIATPNDLHITQGLMCCERGLPFLLEKPVTATLEEAAQLVKAVDAGGVKTLVGHHRRYLAVVQEAKRRIGDGELGAMVAASVVWATRKPDPYFDTAWRRTLPGGGPLLLNGIHEIDMLRHLCGEVRSIGGLVSHARRRFEVEDSAAAIIEFENGCLGTLICTDAGYSPWTMEQGTKENPTFPYADQSSYRLVGSKGSLELPVLRCWGPRAPGEERWDRQILRTELSPPYHDPYRAQLEHFQRLVRLDEPAMVSVRDGANTLAATVAVAQSARDGKRCAPQRF